MPFVDFKALKELVSIEDAANLLKLSLKKSNTQLRGGCPACGNADERILAITPDRGLFYCFDAKVGGDCLALVQHITGLDVKDAAEWLQTSLAPQSAVTAPQKKTEARKQPAPPSKAFDPVAFAAKLVFSEEVKALGLSEEDAERFGVGFYRGKVYIPMRDANGFVAGFVGYAEGQLKMPPQWLDAPNNVVPLKRGA